MLLEFSLIFILSKCFISLNVFLLFNQKNLKKIDRSINTVRVVFVDLPVKVARAWRFGCKEQRGNGAPRTDRQTFFYFFTSVLLKKKKDRKKEKKER